MLWTHVAAVLAGIVIGGAGAWQTQNWRYEAKEVERVKAEQVAAKKVDDNTKVAATNLETDKAKIEVKYRTITKTVTKYVDRPVYQNTCLDQDGIDAINGVVR